MPISPGTTRSTGSLRPAASSAARSTTRSPRSLNSTGSRASSAVSCRRRTIGRILKPPRSPTSSMPAMLCRISAGRTSPRRLANLDLREHRGFQRAARSGGRGDVPQARSRARGKEPRGGLEGSDGEVARLGKNLRSLPSWHPIGIAHQRQPRLGLCARSPRVHNVSHNTISRVTA